MSSYRRLNDPEFLVGCWPGDSNPADVSGHNGDGTWAGTELYLNSPLGRMAFDFNGASYVDLGDYSLVDGVGEVTFAAWIRPDLLNAEHAVLRKWRAGEQSFIFGIDNTNNDELEMAIRDSSANILDVRTTTVGLVVGVWKHIVGVWHGGNSAAIYVDGVSYALTTDTAGNPTDIDDSSERLAIGARYNNGAPDLYFDGGIADVRIYRCGLTGDESKALFLQSQSGGL